MSDYIWDRQHWDTDKRGADDPYGKTQFERMETLAGFIPFGSPIPLFTVGYKPVESITFPPKNLPEYLQKEAKQLKWLNFYDEDDVFGWPLKHLESYEDKHEFIDDKRIDVGFTLLCHIKYWTDNSFTESVADYISGILNLCQNNPENIGNQVSS